jgi:hypothetical protein
MTNQQVMARPGAITNHNMINSHRSTSSHKLLYRRWLSELWDGRRVAGDLVSDDFVGHWPTHDVHGPDELQAKIDQTRHELRELLFAIHVGPFVDGDMVAARWIATGSGEHGPARFTGNDILRIANGKIVEFWSGTSAA